MKLKCFRTAFQFGRIERAGGKNSEEIVRIRVLTTSLKFLRNQAFVRLCFVYKAIHVQAWTITMWQKKQV